MADLVTAEELARYLKVHHATIYRLLKKHGIPAIRVRGNWRFDLRAIDEWIKERERVVSYGTPMPLRGRTRARDRRLGPPTLQSLAQWRQVSVHRRCVLEGPMLVLGRRRVGRRTRPF